MPTDTKLDDLIVNSLTREQYHNANFTGHENELFVQSDHAGVSVGGVGVDALDTTNITNCITHIPQDIKLELNNGALTLKAGSKVYVPNGSGVFNELIIQNDLTTITSWGQQVQLGLFVKSDGSTMFIINMEERCSSGSTPPTATNIQMWYDTTNNLVKRYASGSDTGDRYSLPIALVQKGDAVESSNISSIDQVFNGFGYIGSTVFALPGVKGLIPNGRNADGSLKNTEWVASQVITSTLTFGAQYYYFGVLNNNQELAFYGKTVTKYDEKNNVIIDTYPDPDVIVTGWSFFGECIADSNSKIKAFTPKTVFHAVDYSDFADLSNEVVKTTGINKSQRGYIKLGNGLIIQWLNNQLVTQNTAITLPTAFTSATSYSAIAVHFGTSETAYPLTTWAQTSTTVTFNRYSGTGNDYRANIIAIGY